jgi:hypothetical protein
MGSDGVKIGAAAVRFAKGMTSTLDGSTASAALVESSGGKTCHSSTPAPAGVVKVPFLSPSGGASSAASQDALTRYTAPASSPCRRSGCRLASAADDEAAADDDDNDDVGVNVMRIALHP